MIKSLLYKEWLKVRWTYIGLFILNMVAVLSICISLYNDFRFYESNKIYGDVVFWQNLFYADLMYIPLATGILLGIVQFFPEMNFNRLKLTLHLPLKESASLFSMEWFGLILLCIIFLFDVIAVSVFSSHYFPMEVVKSYLMVSFPWFLAGLTAYIFISIVFIEPSWSRRLIISIVGVGFVSWYFDTFIFMGLITLFNRSYFYFLILTILLTPIILFSGYNYKRGLK